MGFEAGDLQQGLDMFFGASTQTCPTFDVSMDGMVDVGELQLGLNNFFGSCPSSCVPK